MKPNYHQYHITETGKIYLNGKIHPTRITKKTENKTGGDVVAYLRIDGKGKAIRVAQAVCRIYKDVPDNHHAVIFLDGDKTNICLENMVTMTASDAGKWHSPPKEPKVNGGYKPKPPDEVKINLGANISWK